MCFYHCKKDTKGRTITNVFQNKIGWEIWVDKGNKFYNKSIKSWLLGNDIEMYSTDNEEKSVVAERFIRILKYKIYKYKTSISKNVYIDNSAEIVNEHNNTYHRTIKIKSVHVKSGRYIDFGVKNKSKDPRYKVGDQVIISKYRKKCCKKLAPKIV